MCVPPSCLHLSTPSGVLPGWLGYSHIWNVLTNYLTGDSMFHHTLIINAHYLSHSLVALYLCSRVVWNSLVSFPVALLRIIDFLSLLKPVVKHFDQIIMIVFPPHQLFWKNHLTPPGPAVYRQPSPTSVTRASCEHQACSHSSHGGITWPKHHKLDLTLIWPEWFRSLFPLVHSRSTSEYDTTNAPSSTWASLSRDTRGPRTS